MLDKSLGNFIVACQSFAQEIEGMNELVGTKMVEDGKTARAIFEEVMANPARKKFGFGERLAIVNVDVQQADRKSVV